MQRNSRLWDSRAHSCGVAFPVLPRADSCTPLRNHPTNVRFRRGRIRRSGYRRVANPPAWRKGKSPEPRPARESRRAAAVLPPPRETRSKRDGWGVGRSFRTSRCSSILPSREGAWQQDRRERRGRVLAALLLSYQRQRLRARRSRSSRARLVFNRMESSRSETEGQPVWAVRAESAEAWVGLHQHSLTPCRSPGSAAWIVALSRQCPDVWPPVVH